MTADPHVTHGTFVDVVIHVSGLVCLEPSWMRLVPGHSTSARATSRGYRRLTHLTPSESRTPAAVEPGL